MSNLKVFLKSINKIPSKPVEKSDLLGFFEVSNNPVFFVRPATQSPLYLLDLPLRKQIRREERSKQLENSAVAFAQANPRDPEGFALLDERKKTGLCGTSKKPGKSDFSSNT